MGIALEDAYETLHRAILTLGPERKDTICTGELTLEAARRALTTLQMALVWQLELLDPDQPLKDAAPAVQASTLAVPFTARQIETIRRLGKAHGEDSPEMTASRIILTWLQQNGFE